jgi:hypothetical protein
MKLAAERNFSIRVDIPVPPVVGLGNSINEMEAWCRANIRAGEWEQPATVRSSRDKSRSITRGSIS